MKVLCTKCSAKYEFKERWFKNNDPSTFVCRKCKIRESTQNQEFKESAKARSIAALANEDIRERMSILASIRAINNADKISESLKKTYKSKELRDQISERVSEKWKDPEYRSKVSSGIKEKWEDPEYRGSVLGSRAKLRKAPQKAIKQLAGHKYDPCFSLGIYQFDLLIDDVFLYDEQPSEEKRLFVEHYFKNFVYINDLAEVKKLES